MLQRAPTPDDILRHAEDDYEEAPWLVMGSPQGWSVNHFASTLQAHAHTHHFPWTVATLLGVRYWSHRGNRLRTLSPDAFVAFVPDRPRDFYYVDREGAPPAFVLEVVSPNSVERDVVEKREFYEEMGVLEYALFGPAVEVDTAVEWVSNHGELEPKPWPASRKLSRLPIEPPLQGWRRDTPTEAFVPWEPDDSQEDFPGRLWSEALGLWLVPQGEELALQDRDGNWLPSHEEAWTENERLRSEIEQLRRQIEQPKD